MTSSAWYCDPAALLAHVRLAGGGPMPAIPGYDGLVEIRRGGQGVVYAATQRSTRRRVAIKLLLDGAYASDATRRRFEREIDLVASLRNPNIVQIFDSGVTAEGRPYLVMEYVDGAALDRYVHDTDVQPTRLGSTASVQPRTRTERILRLFLPVCDAIQHAHQRGVIHRDLKPANIRVDSDGVPRVLDFGLARAALAPGDSHDLTVSGQFIGSLPWATPEHASGNPESIDTRSDIYALGVVLYVLLTKQFPYTVDAPLRDVLNTILQATPTRPSMLERSLDADIETILLKCLAKEPDRRYQSAGDLAADLRSYLAGEPIQARRDSAWYTLRKTLRRFQWAAGSAAAIVILVTFGLLVSVRLGQQADRERARADQERQRAEQERAVALRKTQQAEAVSGFLVTMLSAADPTVEQGRDVRVADVLDRAAGGVAEELEDQPATELAVRSAIGRSYLMLGLYDEAAEQLQAALAVSEDHVPHDDLDRLEARQRLAEVRHRQGRIDEAVTLLRELVVDRRRVSGAGDAQAHSALLKLAMVLSDGGERAEAEGLAEEAVEAGRLHLGAEHRQTLAAMHLLAVCRMRAGRLAEAEALFEETLALRQQVLGADDTETITTMSDLAHVLWQRGEKERADEMFVRIYESTRRSFGDEHPRTLLGLVNLGHSRMGLKHTDEALAFFERALEGQRRVLGPDHREIINTSAALATALRSAGRLDEAEPVYRQVAEAAPRVLGADHPDTLIYLSNFGSFLMAVEKPAEAEVVYRQVYEAALAKIGDGHWMTAAFRGNLGESLLLQERYAEAETHLLAAYGGLVAALGREHERCAGAASDLVKLYDAWGKADLAEPYRQQAAAAE